MNAPRQPQRKGFATKHFRPVEYIIEKGIAAIAFLSLACIVLIFAFVFRETSGLFIPKTTKVETHISSSATANQGPETYGESTAQAETYGDPAPAAATAQAETYGEPSKPEEYGAAPSTAMSTADSIAAAMANSESSEGGEDAHDPENERKVAVASLGSTEWQPVSNTPRYGILPLFIGSLKIALVAILFGAPIAVLAALYTSTFAPKWAREWLKPAIEILAGFPSVVIGFFALMVLASLFQNVFGYEFRLNAFVGGIAMSLAVIPVIYTLSEDALSSVPKSYKDASMALGTQPWETAIFVALPAAIPGIFAGILLGVGRAIGETMIALMATGNAALISANPFEPVRTLSASIGAEMAEVVVGDAHYGVLFLLGTLLFAVSFTLNLLVEFFVRQYLMRKFRGA